MAKEITSFVAGEKPSTATYSPSMETLSGMGWQAANFVTVLVVVSTSIALVHSPINSLMLNRIQYGRALPRSSETNAGVLAAVRSLYTGMGSNLAGSGVRTAYVTGAKKNGNGADATEGQGLGQDASNDESELTLEIKNPLESPSTRVGYVMAVSLGDVLLTNFFETRSHLTKLGVIKADFNWKIAHNFIKLNTTAISMRYGAAMVSFSALCMGEEYISNLIPVSAQSGNHFIAGAVSGMGAAILSFPFSYYRDIVLSKSVVMNGQLITPSAFGPAVDALHHAKTMGLLQIVKCTAKEFVVQLPLRMARTGATFALVSGVGAALGKEPIARFAGGSAATSRPGGHLFSFFCRPENGSNRDEKNTADASAGPPESDWL